MNKLFGFKKTFSILISFSFIVLNFLFGFAFYIFLKFYLHFSHIFLSRENFSLIVELSTNLFMLIFLLCIIAKKLKIDIKENICRIREDFFENILTIISFPFGFVVLVIIWYYLKIPIFNFKVFESNYLGNIIRNETILWIALGFINMCIFVPIKEEIIIRRLLYVSLRRKYNFIVSVFISGMLFSLIHSNFLTSFIYNIVGCYIYERFGKLNITIFIHAITNFLLLLIAVIVKILLSNNFFASTCFKVYQ